MTLPQLLVPQVLGDLAQPDGQLAGAVEAADGANRLVKGLLGQLLRQVRVPALRQEKFIDRVGVTAVDGVHILHAVPSFRLIYPPERGFVTGEIIVSPFSAETKGEE